MPVHLETTAREIACEDDLVVLKTDKGDLRSRTVIVAGGHGAFEPKKLPVSDVDMTPVGGPRRRTTWSARSRSSRASAW